MFSNQPIAHLVAQHAHVQLLQAKPVPEPVKAKPLVMQDAVRKYGPTILKCLDQGDSCAQIARDLKLSRYTVNAYASKYKKALEQKLL